MLVVTRDEEDGIRVAIGQYSETCDFSAVIDVAREFHLHTRSVRDEAVQIDDVAVLHASRHFRRNSYRPESKEKRYQGTPSSTNLLECSGEPVNLAMLDSQKLRAGVFFSMTRICHRPGQRRHTSVANSVPIPRCRYRRRTKNSAMSQTWPSPNGSEFRVTRANPTSLP